MLIVVIAGASALGALCTDGVFGSKLPGAHHCDYCGAWLCPGHYSDHLNAGEHGYHHSDTVCSQHGKIETSNEDAKIVREWHMERY